MLEYVFALKNLHFFCCMSDPCLKVLHKTVINYQNRTHLRNDVLIQYKMSTFGSQEASRKVVFQT